ncbi:MAG: NUDIX domain-containing protein [Acidimicrobiia bacterium]
MSEVAFGGIVWRKTGNTLQLLVVHRPRYDDWSFPKGLPLPGETSEETALREVEEETGLRCRLGMMVGEKTYELPDGSPKTSYYWAMTEVTGDFSPNREVDTVRWVEMDDAPELLTYESDRELLESLPDGWKERVPRLFVIRHAHAGIRDETNPADRDRTLSEQGWREARGLVGVLAGEHIGKLLSSPYPRCRQTLEPLSEALGLPVEEVDDLSEDHPERSLPYLGERDGVVCTHGNVIPLMLDALLEDGCDFLSPRKWEKGSTWVIDFDGELAARARYVDPPH